MPHFPNSDDLCTWVKTTHGATVVLSFSLGKDSIAAYLKLREHGFKVLPVYMYLVPHLRLVDDALAYYAQVFGTAIVQLPHPALYRMWNEAVFLPPQRLTALDALLDAGHLEQYDFDDLFLVAKLAHGLPADTFVAVGVTMNDNMTRRASIKKHGPVNESRRQFYPIFDYTRTQIAGAIRAAGLALPKDYILFGRSLDGIDYRFTKPLHDHAPDDFARLAEYFPLVEADLYRMAFRRDARAAQEQQKLEMA